MPVRKIALMSAAASFAFGTPAIAQMNMNMPGMKMPMPKKAASKKKVAPAKTGSSAKRGVKTRPLMKTASTKKRATSQAKHGMQSMPGMRMGPGQKMENMAGKSMPRARHTRSQGQQMRNMPGMQMHPEQTMPGMTMPSGQTPPPGQTMQNMPGMQMPQGQTMPNMPGMAVPGTSAPSGTDLPAGNAAPPPLPTDHAADQVYGSQAMAMGRHHLQTFHGGQNMALVFFNLAEYQFREGRNGYEWNGEAWYGGDINRAWLKSEGDGTVGKSLDRAEVQALYSHAIDPYFNLQAGLRYDFKPNPSRVYATVGLEGLAPSFFEVEGALFLSNKGELLARAEGYYDQRITQRLILQPRAELNFAAQDSRDINIGAGLSNAELGLRLRYDVTRQFSPYVGVQYSRAFGATRRFQQAAGGWELLTGLRTWF